MFSVTPYTFITQICTNLNLFCMNIFIYLHFQWLNKHYDIILSNSDAQFIFYEYYPSIYCYLFLASNNYCTCMLSIDYHSFGYLNPIMTLQTSLINILKRPNVTNSTHIMLFCVKHHFDFFQTYEGCYK